MAPGYSAPRGSEQRNGLREAENGRSVWLSQRMMTMVLAPRDGDCCRRCYQLLKLAYSRKT